MNMKPTVFEKTELIEVRVPSQFAKLIRNKNIQFAVQSAVIDLLAFEAARERVENEANRRY